MISTYIIYFVLSWAVSFLGTLPFGPINLSVVDTTLSKNFRAGIIFASAAALIEIVQSFLALHCSRFIVQTLEENPYVKAFTVGIFILLGIIFLLRKSREEGVKKEKRFKFSTFQHGLFISSLNMQAIPFWVFVITYLQTANLLQFDFSATTITALFFLSGAALGKFSALYLYAKLSLVISEKVGAISLWMNKIIGAILLFIGLIQGIRFFY
ncbi:MAG: LysE family transporter [Chitinophagales bacterium]